MSARIRGASSELQELGEEEDEFTKDTSKLQALVKGMTGFDILEQDGQTFKDIYEIMIGIGEQWDKLTDVQQASLGEKLAGKRNANGFYAVMGNIDRLKSIYQTAETSEGSAQRAEEVFETSIQYSINKAKASLQELSYDFLDSGLFKGLVEGANAFLQVLDQIIETLGTIPPLLATIGGARALKQTLGGNTNWIQNTIAKATRMKTGEASSSIVKNLKDLFTSSAQKANVGGEIAEIATAQLAKTKVGTEVIKITADQVAKAGVSTDVDFSDFLGGFKGKTINLSDDVASAFAMEGGTYAINEAGEAVTVLTDKLDDIAPAAASAGAEVVKVGGRLSSVFSGLTSILAANPILTGALAIGAVAGIVKLVDYINKAGERAKSKMDDSVKDYTESNQKIEDLNGQLKETQDRIKELNSQDTLTLVERNELQNLEQVNKSLETQIESQKTLNRLKADQLLTDTGKAFAMNLGEDLPTFLDVENDLAAWAKEFPNDTGLFQAHDVNTSDLREQLSLYTLIAQRMEEAAEAEDEEWFEGLKEGKGTLAKNIADQLDYVQSTVSAYELIGVENLSSAEKHIYNSALQLRDTIMHVIDPDQWKMGQIDKLFADKRYAKDIEKFRKEINQIMLSGGAEMTDDELLSQAIDQLASKVPPTMVAKLEGLEFTAEDFIETLVADAINGVDTVSDYIDTSFIDSKDRVASLSEGVNKLRDDALNRSPAESVSMEDYQLVMDTPALRDYAEAFEMVNGVMTVNRDKWKEITEAKLESERVNLEGEKKAAQDRLAQYKTDLQDLETQILSSRLSPEAMQALGDAYKQTQDNIDETEREIKGYDLLIQTLGEGTDAYHTFVAAQNAATSGEMFDSAAEAYQALYDIFDPNSDTFGMSGAGNPVYEAAIEFVIPEEVREKGEQEIQNYLRSMWDYLETDADGKFTGELKLKDFATNLEHAVNLDEGMQVFPDFKSKLEYLISDAGAGMLKAIASEMKLTEDALRAMIGEIMMYGDNVNEISLNLDFKDAIEGSNTLISNLSTIDGMLGKALGTSDLQSIFGSEQLKKYSSALEVVNGQLQLNAEKVKQIHDEEVQAQKDENLRIIKGYKDELGGIVTPERAEWLRNRITELEAYNAALDATSTKFTEFRQAQEMEGQQGQLFKDTTDAFQAIRDAFDETSESFGKKGLVYEAAIKLVIPESVRDQGEQAIENYVDDMAKFWREDVDGKFTGELDFGKISDSLKIAQDKMARGGRQIDIAKLLNLGETDKIDLANYIGISTEGLESIIGVLQEYGITTFEELDAMAEQMNFKQAVEDSANLESNLSTIDSLLNNIMSGKSLSISDIQSLFATDQLKEYIAALKVVDGQLVFDPNAVRGIREKQINDQISANNAMIKNYLKQPESKVNTERITQLQLLNQALKESTSSYNQWVEAQSAENYRQTYIDNAIQALERINDYFQTDSGVFGQSDVALEAAIKFIVPDDIDKTDKENVHAYLDSISDLLVKDAKGNIKGLNLKSFLNKAVEKQLVSIDDGVYKRAANKTAKDWANALGVSMGMVETAWKNMDLFGGDVTAINTEEFKNWLSSFNEAYNQIDLLNGALAESFSGKGLSFAIDETGELTGNIVDVAKAMQDVPGYRADKLFRLSANGVRVNNDELRKLQATQEKMVKDDFAAKIAAKEKELADARAAGQDTTAIINQLNQLKMLSSAYDGATSAYQKWLDAQSAGEMGDLYDNVRDNALKRGDELLEQGLIGTNEFRAIANMFSFEDLSTASVDDVVAAWQKVDKKIEGTSKTARDFFAEGRKGSENFADALVELDLASYSEEAGYVFEKINFDDLAQRLGVSVDLVTMMFDKLHDYGADIHFFNQDQLVELDQADEKIRQIQGDLEWAKGDKIDITPAVNFKIEDLDTADEIQGKIDSLQRLKAEVPLNSTQLEHVNQMIDELQEKLGIFKEAEYSPNVDISTIRNAQSTVENLKGMLSTAFEANFEVKNSAEINSLAEEIAAWPDELKSTIGLEGADTAEEVLSSIEGMMKDETATKTINTVENTTVTRTNNTPKAAMSETGTVTVNTKYNSPTNASEVFKSQTVDIIPNDQVTPVIEKIVNLQIPPKEVIFEADNNDAMRMVHEVDDEQIKEKKFFITTSNRSAMAQINATKGASIGEKSFRIKALDYASPVISGIKTYLDSLRDKQINITTVKTTVNRTQNEGGPYNGTANRYYAPVYNGTAHAMGTMSQMGNWGIKHNERGSLINELGTEVVVRDGRWFIVNNGDPAFTNLKRGDIVFNHKQTEELFKNGYVTGSHATLVHAEGTAHAEGATGTWKKTPTTTTSGNSGGKSSSGSGNSGNNKSSSNNSSDKEPTKIDWIETLLSRIQRLFDNFKNLAEYYTTFTYQNKELQRAVVQAQQNVNKQQQAAKVYYDLAKSKAGSYWDKIINGALKIEDISNENTAKAVQEAKDLYDKYLQCTDQVVELRKELLELARQKLDNIVDDYDSLNGYAEQYISLLDAQIERRDTMGGQTDILKRNQQDIDQLKQMADYYNDIKTAASDYAATYQGQITDNLAKGLYKIGSQEWIDAKTQLYDLQTQAYEAATNVESLNERIRELNWYSFNEGLAIIEHVDKQLGNTIDLIKDLEVYSDKTAAVNENGISQFNLYASALANARQQVADYSVAIKALDGELASGMITQDKYNEELRDYREKQMDAVKQVKSYRDAIIDLVKKGIQAETKAMSDLISKRKEDLKKQKEANDYAKKISDKTKEINKIKAQITALSGDTTAATQAKIRQLQADLAKQEEELAETRMDHEYDMRTQAMDDELDRFKEIQDAKTLELETSLDTQEKAIAETLAFTSSQYEQITDELTKLAEMYGVQLEDFVVNPWKDATAALEEYKRAIETTPSTTVSIETDNAVHKNNHSGTSGQSTLVESGTNGQSDTPFGQGGPNFTMADATNSEKMRDEIASAEIGKDSDSNQKFTINKSTQVMKDPSSLSTVVKTLDAGAQVTGTTNGKKVSGVWWREVTIDGKNYWIKADDMTRVQPAATTTQTQTKTTTPTTQTQQKTTTTTPATEKYTVKTDKGLYLRKDAGKGNDSIDKIPNGTVVEATGKTKTVDGKVWREIKYNGKTGWSMGDYLIKKAARGARYASGLYLTDEEGVGSEAIITKKGVLRQLDSATVFSKEQTDRLWKLSKSDLLENIKPSAFAGGISLNYGSLLTVNGNVDRDALPGLQDLLKQACEYTKRDLKQNLIKMGMR